LELLDESGIENDEIRTMANLGSGWAILLEAESFCEVVISSGLHNLGRPIPPAEAMGEATARFDAAIAAAAGDDDLADMAQAAWAGKARAHLFRAESVEARTAAGNGADESGFFVPKTDDASF